MRYVLWILLPLALLAGNGPIEVKNVKLTTSEWVVTNTGELAEDNAARFESVPGMVYLVTELWLQVSWDGGVTQIRLDDNDIVVKVGGQSYPMVGRLMNGMYSNGTQDFYASKTSSSHDDNVYCFVPAFRIPAGTRKASLHLGDRLIIDFEVPAPTSLVPEGNKDVRVEVVSSRLLDSVSSESNYNSYTLKTNYTNPYGKILEVKLKVTPLRGNYSATRFSVYTRHFALLLPAPTMVNPIGERFGGKYISSSSSSTLRAKPDGTFPTVEKTFYFGVPANLSEFTILVTGQPVAKALVGR